MMRTPRSSAAALGTAVLLPILALASGCGSDDAPSRAPEPTFAADLAQRRSDPPGCVPNPRDAPRTDPRVPGELTPTGIAVQHVRIPPDRPGVAPASAMAASATLMGTARPETIAAPVTTPMPSDVPVPVLRPAHAGDRFVIVRYRLRNEGSVATTPDQISGHLLLRDGGRWVAPSFRCAFAPESAAGTSLQDAGALVEDAVPGNTRVAPGAAVTAAAAYVVHGDGERWASAPTTSGAMRLRPPEAGPGRVLPPPAAEPGASR